MQTVIIYFKNDKNPLEFICEEVMTDLGNMVIFGSISDKGGPLIEYIVPTDVVQYIRTEPYETGELH